MAEDIPRNVNEGLHRVSYSFVDPKPKIADFDNNFSGKKYSPTKVNSRHFHVSPCVLNSECSYKSRQQARMLHTQQYNSILQCGEKYFKHRNQDEKFKQLKNTQYPMIRENVTETKFEDLTTLAKKKGL